MPSTLRFTPEQSGFSSEEMPGQIVVPLKGGGSRKRQDILLNGHVVNCQWFLNSEEYTEFMGFFVTELHHGADDFLLDLITDIGVPTTHVCRTISGLPKLTQQKYDGYWVTCQLECDKNPTFTDTITYALGDEAVWIWSEANETDVADFGNVTGFERTDEHSYACWFSTSFAGAQYIFFKQDVSATRHGPAIFVQAGTGQIFFNLNNNAPGTNDMSTRTDSGFADGVLHSLVVTYGGGGGTTVNFYIDGALVPMTVVQDALVTSILNTEPLLIGNDLSGFPFDGRLANCAQWDTELTAGDVTDFHAAGPKGNISSLDPIWWARFDESDTSGADGIFDYSGNSGHGTANFEPTISGTTGRVVYPSISSHFKAGDRLRIINSQGIHPDGDIPLNLDGVYDVLDNVGTGAVLLTEPSTVTADWNTLYAIDPNAEYGNEADGNVFSTVTKVPS
jgi:hypothetical protein